MGAKVANDGHHNHTMERSEIEVVVMRKFGDEQSSLLDKFERLSFEVQLNKAMQLGRSLSEPGAMVHAKLPRAAAAGLTPANFPAEPATPEPGLTSEVRQWWRWRRRRSGALKNVLKRLLKPIVGIGIGRRDGSEKKEVMVTDPRDPRFWKAFSRSMRF